MISIEETRELLGPDAVGKTDAELELIRDQTYARVEPLVIAFKRRGAAERLEREVEARRKRPALTRRPR